ALRGHPVDQQLPDVLLPVVDDLGLDDVREAAATGLAVVVDGDDELLVVGDGGAAVGEVGDAVARALGDVDVVGQRLVEAGDDVVVVVRRAVRRGLGRRVRDVVG